MLKKTQSQLKWQLLKRNVTNKTAWKKIINAGSDVSVKRSTKCSRSHSPRPIRARVLLKLCNSWKRARILSQLSRIWWTSNYFHDNVGMFLKGRFYGMSWKGLDWRPANCTNSCARVNENAFDIYLQSILIIKTWILFVPLHVGWTPSHIPEEGQYLTADPDNL